MKKQTYNIFQTKRELYDKSMGFVPFDLGIEQLYTQLSMLEYSWLLLYVILPFWLNGTKCEEKYTQTLQKQSELKIIQN